MWKFQAYKGDSNNAHAYDYYIHINGILYSYGVGYCLLFVCRYFHNLEETIFNSPHAFEI